MIGFNYVKTESDALQNGFERFYSGKKVLVTGGAGFIGSHLVEALVAAGAQVTVFDDLSSGKNENLEAVADRITFVVGSVVNPEQCAEVVRGQEIVFHLAAFVSVPQSIEEPSRCHQVNVDGTFNMLEAARRAHVQSFLFVSSSAVYGEFDGRLTETTRIKPASPYGYSKYLGELMCSQYASVYGMNIMMVRYFNVFGSRQNPDAPYAGVVAKFTQLMNKGEPVTIFGDGNQVRDFIPVSEVVEANMILASQSGGAGEVFNIGTGLSISVNQLFKKLKAEHPSYTHEPRYAPARAGDVYASQADCTKYIRARQSITDSWQHV